MSISMAPGNRPHRENWPGTTILFPQSQIQTLSWMLDDAPGMEGFTLKNQGVTPSGFFPGKIGLCLCIEPESHRSLNRRRLQTSFPLNLINR